MSSKLISYEGSITHTPTILHQLLINSFFSYCADTHMYRMDKTQYPASSAWLEHRLISQSCILQPAQ